MIHLSNLILAPTDVVFPCASLTRYLSSCAGCPTDSIFLLLQCQYSVQPSLSTPHVCHCECNPPLLNSSTIHPSTHQSPLLPSPPKKKAYSSIPLSNPSSLLNIKPTIRPSQTLEFLLRKRLVHLLHINQFLDRKHLSGHLL